AIRAVVDDYRVELGDAMENAVRAASPELADAEVSRRSRILTSLSSGALMIARINRAEAVAVVLTAVHQLDEWQDVAHGNAQRPMR
ncbi:hypothetical protein ACC691_36320, partial [Rhizobium johnstonii]|uniref:hypothetical protein n=1 Tax=Rhizobium johnstonii TaxID=3019933 RepID=UPI003F9B2DE0